MRPRLAVLALAALGCAACGAAAAPRQDSGELRPVDELPPEHRALLADYAAGGEVWAARRRALAGEPELALFLVDNLVLELVRAFGSGSLASTPGDRGPYERALGELALQADVALPVLSELLGVPDDLVAFVAADALREIGQASVAPVAAELADPAWKTRLRAAELLSKLPPAGVAEEGVQAELARRLAEDEAWVVRAQAALTLGERAVAAQGQSGADPGRARVWLEGALRDPDFGVARRAAEALGALGDPRAAPAIEAFLARSARAGELGAVQTGQAALTELRRAPAPR